MAIRNVLFHEIRPTRRKDVDWRLDVSALIAALDSLAEEQRIRETDGDAGDSYEFVQVIDTGANPAIAFVRCREHGLPMLAQQATLEPLQIAADRQLAELTHAVFFRDNIVGAEYNHFGPRLSSLAGYLTDKVPQCLPENKRVLIASLINDDHLSLLQKARTINSISLKMAPQLLDAVEAAQRLSGRAALRSMSEGYGAQRIGLNMQNSDGLDKNEVIALVNWAFEQGTGLLSSATAEVRLEDGTKQPLNLLRTRIGAEREMDLIGPNARSIAHASARLQMVDAFNSLSEQIKEASSMWGSESEDART